ncbi:MAG: hypothetical protein BWX68_02898 [Verrucomicrobia bacterium ADurb.Bin063]|nr:MAG: hypothetical protein BWX68_02898 [Verrucomicrobia bacterium ADurb.Bin063]
MKPPMPRNPRLRMRPTRSARTDVRIIALANAITPLKMHHLPERHRPRHGRRPAGRHRRVIAVVVGIGLRVAAPVKIGHINPRIPVVLFVAQAIAAAVAGHAAFIPAPIAPVAQTDRAVESATAIAHLEQNPAPPGRHADPARLEVIPVAALGARRNQRAIHIGPLVIVRPNQKLRPRPARRIHPRKPIGIAVITVAITGRIALPIQLVGPVAVPGLNSPGHFAPVVKHVAVRGVHRRVKVNV